MKYYYKLHEGKNIQVLNYHNCKHGFTFVDDIVEGVVRVMQKTPGKMNSGLSLLV